MTYEEFDALCNYKISDEDFKKVEFVYTYHPCNFHKGGIARLVEEFGMVIIYDMLPRAQAAMEQELHIRTLREELRRVEEQLNEAMSIDMCSEKFVSEEG